MLLNFAAQYGVADSTGDAGGSLSIVDCNGRRIGVDMANAPKEFWPDPRTQVSA
jgi:hypothetical protein